MSNPIPQSASPLTDSLSPLAPLMRLQVSSHMIYMSPGNALPPQDWKLTTNNAAEPCFVIYLIFIF